jgi:rhodanese-related sulfurtransferase
MDLPRITPRQVAERLDHGERIAFVDSRSAHAYEQATHQIPGSIRIAPDQVDGHTDDLPRGATVVAYCT